MTGRPLQHDHTNERFGLLVAKEHLGYGKWSCRCRCGSEIVVNGSDLRAGKVISCGCARNSRIRELKLKHGMHGTRIYRVWRDMLNRCYYQKHERFAHYGGRGIKICDEWRNDFQAFYEWAMATGYDQDAAYGKCTLDRIDVNGNYEPSNCRWVDMVVQANNRRPFAVKTKNKRPVNLLGEDGSVIKRYSSISDASKDTGCRRTSITRVCNGRQKTSLGMKWCYA